MTFPDTDLDIIIEAYLGADPTADPSTWAAPTDLSSRLMRKPIPVRRGRGKGQKTLQSGSCVFWLENTDGALTPLLATSTYFPDWDLGVPMRVSVDYGGTYVRFAGFVADISAVIVPGTGGNMSAVKVTLGGVWRRITQGAAAKSPLRRTIEALSPVLYLPFEDAEGATVVGSGVPGGPNLPITAGTTLTLGVTGLCDGTVSCADLGLGGQGSTPDLSLAPMTSWSLSFICKLTRNTVADTVRLFTVYGPIRIDVYSLFDTVSAVVTAASGGEANMFAATGLVGTSPVVHQFTVTVAQSGTSIACQLLTDGAAVGVHPTETISNAAVESPTRLAIRSRMIDGSAIAAGSELLLNHLFIVEGVYSGNLNASPGPITAYTGEEAHVRFARNCAEEGIPYSGTGQRSATMGTQDVDDITGVLADCETVDHGMIVEDLAFGLDYRAWSQRVNLDPSMEVDLSTYRTTSGTQGDVLTPVRNDARLRNEWTITRKDGSTDTAADRAHQAKRGRYNDSATVNIEADTTVLDEAWWRVHEGTFDGLRYDTVPLDLAANLGD